MSNIQPLPFRRPTMLNYVEATDEPFDIVVIGGGATGVYVALDAAARGYRTALFERDDFASGTSSKSTKLIHGGVRYMQQGRLRLVRESLRERHRLMQNAPHLVNALPILVPAYSRWQRLKYTAGVMSYDAVSRGHGIGGTRRLGPDDSAVAVPGINRQDLRGGTVYLDGQTDDARLALAVARTAAAHGAATVNYAEVKALRTDTGRVTGVEVEDLLTGESLQVDARVVINATGTYADKTMTLDPGGASGLMRWSRGTHIVLNGSLLKGNHGLLVPETSDGRVIYALPWLGGTLVGTTDVPVNAPDAAARPPSEDIEFLIDEIQSYLPEASESKVLSTWTGIRPLVSNDASSPTSSIARSHQIMTSRSGLITIAGGKWTTARLMAEQTVERAIEVAGLPRSQCPTESLRLDGFDHGASDRHILEAPISNPDSLYGTSLSAIRELEQRWPELNSPLAEGLPYRLSHAVYATREEMAQTLNDVLARRTRSMFLDVDAALSAAPAVTEAVEQHGSVARGWAAQELGQLQAVANRFQPPD